MQTLIIGTKNPAKIGQIRDALSPLNITISGLPSDRTLPDIKEDGKTPQENAKKKAIAYALALNMPVLSMDNALYIEGLEPDKQPGVNVRRIQGATDRPTDEELLHYFQELFTKLGNKVQGHWEFAICLAYPNRQTKEKTIVSTRAFTSIASTHMISGYPLESLSIDPDTNKYISEMSEEEQKMFWQKTIGKPLVEFIQEIQM